MKKLIFLIASALSAQTLSLTMPPTAKPGSQVSFSVTLGGTGSPIAALQFLVSQPVGVITGTIGPTPQAATKTLTCNPSGAPAGYKCVIVGPNKAVIAPGDVARLTFTVPATQAPGPISISLAGVVAASPEATNVPITVSPTASVRIILTGDVNGDGKVDLTDLYVLAGHLIGLAPTTTDEDLDGDGFVTVLDAQMLANILVEAQ